MIFSDLLNSIMAISTGIMTIATFLNAREMKITRKETNRANVAIFIEHTESELYFVIKNFGQTGAREVKLSSDSDIEDITPIRLNSLFEHTIKYIAPQMEIKTYIGKTHDFFNESKIHNFNHEITVEFLDIYSNKQSNTYSINIDYFEDIGTL